MAWASKTLPDVTSDVEVSVWFQFDVSSESVWLTRLRTGSNGNLMKVMVNNGGKLVYRNDVAGVTRASTQVVTNGEWHHLQARVTVAGANGHVQILLDGVPVVRARPGRVDGHLAGRQGRGRESADRQDRSTSRSTTST